MNKAGPWPGTMHFSTTCCRRKEWAPTHAFFLLDGGPQIATSQFHTLNHNLILEGKVIIQL